MGPAGMFLVSLQEEMRTQTPPDREGPARTRGGALGPPVLGPGTPEHWVSSPVRRSVSAGARGVVFLLHALRSFQTHASTAQRRVCAAQEAHGPSQSLRQALLTHVSDEPWGAGHPPCVGHKHKRTRGAQEESVCFPPRPLGPACPDGRFWGWGARHRLTLTMGH